jgi:hypothetical protein
MLYPIVYITRPNDLTYDHTLRFHALQSLILDEIYVYGEKDHLVDSLRYQFPDKVEVLISLNSDNCLPKLTKLCEKILYTILNYIHMEIQQMCNEDIYMHPKTIVEYATSYWMNSVPQFDIHIVLYDKCKMACTEGFIKKKYWKLSENTDNLQNLPSKIKIKWTDTTN